METSHSYKSKTPPVKSFWPLILYNEFHFFHPNPLKRYSLGTKSKAVNYNMDGSLIFCAGAKPQVLALHPRVMA
jgi:hypothetical protein